MNIADLLNSKTGIVRLYCPIYPCTTKDSQYNCTLVRVEQVKGNNLFIKVRPDGEEFSCVSFHSDTALYSGGEPMLFPSKEVRDWENFNVKYVHGCKGKHEEIKTLLKDNGGINTQLWSYSNEDSVFCINTLSKEVRPLHKNDPISDYILSIGTELKLEYPKFKEGDVVKDTNALYILDKDTHDLYYLSTWYANQNVYPSGRLHLTLATPEEIAKWNKETLEPNHLHYSKSKRKIIDWFKEFDKVVVRNRTLWVSRTFDYYSSGSKHYYCQDGNGYMECLPYNEKTAKLIGTTDDWKEK